MRSSRPARKLVSGLRPEIGNQIGPENENRKKSPKIGFSPDFLFLGFLFFRINLFLRDFGVQKRGPQTGIWARECLLSVASLPCSSSSHMIKGVHSGWRWLVNSSRTLSAETPYIFGDGPNTVSESTVSNTELSEFFGLTEFRGANSVSSFQPIICVPRRTHRVFRRTHRVCAPKLSEFSSPKQYSRNSIPPVSSDS